MTIAVEKVESWAELRIWQRKCYKRKWDALCRLYYALLFPEVATTNWNVARKLR